MSAYCYLKVGGTDDVPNVMEASNGHEPGERTRLGFINQPSPISLRIPLTMGKVLGEGSSVNVIVHGAINRY